MRLPTANCQQFILCDGGQGLTLSCRTTEPNFNRCTQRCEIDTGVCQITDCGGGGVSFMSIGSFKTFYIHS